MESDKLRLIISVIDAGNLFASLLDRCHLRDPQSTFPCCMHTDYDLWGLHLGLSNRDLNHCSPIQLVIDTRDGCNPHSQAGNKEAFSCWNGIGL